MPLSPFQVEVLRLIACNRSPDSYVAGATVLHREKRTPRYSLDLDLFHDLEESVALCAEADATTLREAGYEVSWLLRTSAFHRAVTRLGAASLRIEWAHDSAFRFYPIQQDDRCGYRLHDADAAINKVLALAGRNEIRDFVDVLHLHDTYLSLGALAWAACGQDPGYTPDFLLEQTARHAAYTETDLHRLALREPLDLGALKRRWLTAMDEARTLVADLPASEVGSLYLDSQGSPATPDPSSAGFRSLTRHWGSVRGAWPTVAAPRA